MEVVLGYAPGCVDSKYLEVGAHRPTTPGSYIQCKMSNMLHTLELPRRHPGKVSALAVDLGWVSTNIQVTKQREATLSNVKRRGTTRSDVKQRETTRSDAKRREAT